MKNKLIITAALGVLTALILGVLPAYAASETDEAAAYLAERGVFEGDENGNLNLDKSLTRAELAVILTRLDFITEAPGGLDEWRGWGAAHFADPESRYNTFTDVPEWALPYVEYCYQRGLMKGVGDNRFDPYGEVSPKMLCAVILRFLGIPETDWSFDMSVVKARELGVAPGEGLDEDTVTRGAVAVVVRRGMEYEAGASASVTDSQGVIIAPPNTTEVPTQSAATDMTIDEMKAEIVRLTNEERVKAGLPALEILPELMVCAQAKADDMIYTGYVQHRSPTYGKASEMIRSFVPNAATTAENVTFGPASTPESAFQAWLDSEGHRENILNERVTHIGIGIAKWEAGASAGRYAWVQQFVRLKQ